MSYSYQSNSTLIQRRRWERSRGYFRWICGQEQRQWIAMAVSLQLQTPPYFGNTVVRDKTLVRIKPFIGSHPPRRSNLFSQVTINHFLHWFLMNSSYISSIQLNIVSWVSFLKCHFVGFFLNEMPTNLQMYGEHLGGLLCIYR